MGDCCNEIVGWAGNSALRISFAFLCLSKVLLFTCGFWKKNYCSSSISHKYGSVLKDNIQ
jgi:hypothetical protein